MAEAHREEIAKLEALYASNPEGRVFTHLAEVYRKSGDLEKARQILTDGIRRHPDSASAFVVLGRVLSDSGDGPAGFDAFKRALDLDTGNLVALRWCGDLAMRAGRVDDALGFYQELIARDPSDAANLRERVAVIESDRDAAMSQPPNASGAAAVETPEYPSAMVPHPSAELHFEPTDLSGDQESHPAGSEDYDPSALPGDLAAFAGKQIESRTGKSWEPPDSEVDAEFQAADDFMFAGSIEEAAGSADDDGLDAFVLEGLASGSGMEPSDSSLDNFGNFDLAGDEAVDVFAASDELIGFEAPRDDVPESNPIIQPDDSLYGTNPSEVDATSFEMPVSAIEAEPAFEAEPAYEAEPAFEAEPAYEPEATAEADAPFEMASTFEPDAAADEEATPEPTEVAEAAFDPDAMWTMEPAEPIELELEADAEAEAEQEPQAVASSSAASVGGSGLVTETMAELYRNQGFPDRAADVYRQLIHERGGDARVEKMLAEIEGSVANAGPQDDLVLDQDAAGEMWLKDEVSPWTSTEPGGAEHSSASAWEHSADEQVGGAPIGSYFASLLQWRSAPAEQAAEEPATANGADPSIADSSIADTDEVYDDVLLLDDDSEDPGPELPMFDTSSDAAPVAFEAPAPAPVARPAVNQDPMPWDAPSEPAAPSAVAPTPPAAAAPPAAVPPAAAPPASTEELMPWETGHTDAAAPVPAAAPPQAAPAIEASPDRSPSGGDAGGDAEGEDDEDLEMFRSWLQSLKK